MCSGANSFIGHVEMDLSSLCGQRAAFRITKSDQKEKHKDSGETSDSSPILPPSTHPHILILIGLLVVTLQNVSCREEKVLNRFYGCNPHT